MARPISLLAGLSSLFTAIVLAWHHPSLPGPLLGILCLWMLACYLRPEVWLVGLPALLPVVDIASWTGWLTFEEFDILVLGAAAGGYLRWAVHEPQLGASKANSAGPVAGYSLGVKALLSLFFISLAVSAWRGFVDAGGFEFGWYQGYEGPMNSVRLFKGFILALLLAPLIGRELNQSDALFTRRFSLGLLAGAGVVSLVCLWERVAFPGLLNFSADYRTTALFWEMHVGGAALDGFLALTVPFVVLSLTTARTRGRVIVALLLAGMAGYASLTTFSRGVYLGALVGLGLLLLLLARRARTDMRPGWLKAALVLVACVLFASQWVFASGGYRALLAVLGIFGITLWSGERLRATTAHDLVPGLGMGVLLALVAWAAAEWLGKGAYLSYVAAFVFCAGLRWGSVAAVASMSKALLVSGLCWLHASALLVALVWGGQAALGDMSVALLPLALLAAVAVVRRETVWPASLRWQGSVFAVALTCAAGVAVFGGGAYMGDRFSTSQRDLAGRVQHWSAGLDMLQSPADWLFGRGLGRYPATSFFSSRTGEFPGSYRLMEEGDNRFLRLSGPRHPFGNVEYLRMSQRMRPLSGEGGQYQAEFDIRVSQPTAVTLEICEKHLLYSLNCTARTVGLKPDGPPWQHVKVALDGRRLSAGPRYAPRLAFFSVALTSSGVVADVDNLRLVGGATVDDLLANGDFSKEMAHWFFTSDHHHLPWHIKNLFMNVLFDQGIVGLSLFVALLAAAFWRVSVGSAAEHALAPYLAASVAWFVVVGAFDSLLDVPRVAFLFYLMLLLGLMLNRSAQRARLRRRSSRRSRSGRVAIA